MGRWLVLFLEVLQNAAGRCASLSVIDAKDEVITSAGRGDVVEAHLFGKILLLFALFRRLEPRGLEFSESDLDRAVRSIRDHPYRRRVPSAHRTKAGHDDDGDLETLRRVNAHHPAGSLLRLGY